jgi:hypothetical protein
MIKISYKEWFKNFANSITTSLGSMKPLTAKRASQLFLMRGKITLDKRSEAFFLTEEKSLQRGERRNEDILAETRVEKMKGKHYPFYRLLSLRQRMYAAIDRITSKNNSFKRKSNIPSMILKGSLSIILLIPELIAFSIAKIPDRKSKIPTELQQPLLSRQSSSSSSEIHSLSTTVSLSTEARKSYIKSDKNNTESNQNSKKIYNKPGKLEKIDTNLLEYTQNNKLPSTSSKEKNKISEFTQTPKSSTIGTNSSIFNNSSKDPFNKDQKQDFLSEANKKLAILQNPKTKKQYIEKENTNAKQLGKKSKFISYTFTGNVTEKVSERDQIELDELLAKKLQDEINKNTR